jgi:cell division protease FtsH
MGHALVAANLPGVDPILKVSIIPRGVGALGYTIQRPTEDRFLLAESSLKNRITVLMGGRAAESLIFAGDVSTGAADDLQRATEIALEMVTRHGMSDKVGQRTYMPSPHPFLLGGQTGNIQAAEATAREIDIAVRDAIAEAFERATKILHSVRDDLENGASLLLDRETLSAAEFPPIQLKALAHPAAERPAGGDSSASAKDTLAAATARITEAFGNDRAVS